MYLDSNPNVPELGQTVPGLDSDGSTLENASLLGGMKAFPVRDFSATSTPARKLTGVFVVGILLRNISGGALLPGRLARLCDAGSGSYPPGTVFGLIEAVEGYANVENMDTCVLVDPWLPSAGVADDALFWGIIKGPAQGYTPQAAGDANAAIVAGDPIVCSADAQGRVTVPGTPATATAARDQAIGVLGRALSGRAKAETDSQVWVMWNIPIF